MNEDDLLDQIPLFLPKYLTPEHHNQLFSELKDRQNLHYYLPDDRFPDDMLQGDGWTGFVAINFYTREVKPVSGVVLSNSCDVDIKNARELPPNVLFSPLIKLRKIVELLEEAGKSTKEIDSRLESIRRQRVTSIVYFHELPEVIEESVILLDNVHAQPLSDFVGRERARLFTLTQTAFYIFVIKLSIHLTRFQEGVSRF